MCDREGIRTPNPQSRNLIFYPVELRSHFEFGVGSRKLYSLLRTSNFYTKSFLTIPEITFPSA